MSDVIIYNNQPPVVIDVTNPVTQLRYCGIAGYYGQFISTTAQAAANPALAYPVQFATIITSKGITNDNGTKLEFPNAGEYLIQFSVQLQNPTATAYAAAFWLSKNGTDIADTASYITVPAKHGSTPGSAILTIPYIERANAGDYIEFMWTAESAAVALAPIPATTTPPVPRSPAIIVTATQVAD